MLVFMLVMLAVRVDNGLRFSFCFILCNGYNFVFQMHENKYLHLPVVEEDTGRVLGVVSVMEIIQATAGEKGSDR